MECNTMQNLIDVMAVCEMLGGINPATAYRWVKRGLLPKPLKVGGLSRWRKEEIEACFARMVEAR
jgi:predicted DNA-binding transcriptional regulator AlpA